MLLLKTQGTAFIWNTVCYGEYLTTCKEKPFLTLWSIYVVWSALQQ